MNVSEWVPKLIHRFNDDQETIEQHWDSTSCSTAACFSSTETFNGRKEEEGIKGGDCVAGQTKFQESSTIPNPPFHREEKRTFSWSTDSVPLSVGISEMRERRRERNYESVVQRYKKLSGEIIERSLYAKQQDKKPTQEQITYNRDTRPANYWGAPIQLEQRETLFTGKSGGNRNQRLDPVTRRREIYPSMRNQWNPNLVTAKKLPLPPYRLGRNLGFCVREPSALQKEKPISSHVPTTITAKPLSPQVNNLKVPLDKREKPPVFPVTQHAAQIAQQYVKILRQFVATTEIQRVKAIFEKTLGEIQRQSQHNQIFNNGRHVAENALLNLLGQIKVGSGTLKFILNLVHCGCWTGLLVTQFLSSVIKYLEG